MEEAGKVWRNEEREQMRKKYKTNKMYNCYSFAVIVINVLGNEGGQGLETERQIRTQILRL